MRTVWSFTMGAILGLTVASTSHTVRKPIHDGVYHAIDATRNGLARLLADDVKKMKETK